MTPNFSESRNHEIALADYRFSVYRLQVLKADPAAAGAALAAVTSRLERLAAECPEFRPLAA